MPVLKGILVFEGPVYRGNSNKTIFTRGNSNDEITLPGKIGGSAQAMMNAFTGFWQNRNNPKHNNQGLLEQLWQRLYNEKMPGFINDVSCSLDKKITQDSPYFDLKMGIALDRDRMTQAKEQNYKLESVYKGSQFNFSLIFNDTNLDSTSKYKFACFVDELTHGRFWFGALKSRGMGKCRLILDTASQEMIDKYKKQPLTDIVVNSDANYIFIDLEILPDNPLLVSWPWGKPDTHGVMDSWIDTQLNDIAEHKNIMEQVVSGNARNWQDVNMLPGGPKFEQTHQRRGQPMNLNQLKSNFPKGTKNDDILMTFLKGHRQRTHKEINREPHIDFREEKGTVTRGKPYDQLFYRTLDWDGKNTNWELCVPGHTIKGAFRVKAQQIIRTLNNGKGCREETSSHQARFCDDRFCPVCQLFGQQNMIAKAWFTDAHLISEDQLLDNEHCSYDQIATDSETGQSINNSKLNFLYAYGNKFSFRSTIVLRDVSNHDFKQLGFLMYLLREFDHGTIPIGGKKSLNFGAVTGRITSLRILCPSGSPMESLVKKWKFKKAKSEPLWNHYESEGDKLWKNSKFIDQMQRNFANLTGKIQVPDKPYIYDKLVSHRQYSKLCGILTCELEALTPIHVRESGEPTFISDNVLGYDFFSMSPPKNSHKPDMSSREYAIPPSTIRGAIRNIYNLISDNHCPGCKDIGSLCDTCQLFGFVGDTGALMGRLSISFARPIEKPTFEWFGVKYGYKAGEYKKVGKTRLFEHTKQGSEEIFRHGTDDIPGNLSENSTLNRFALPGTKFTLEVKFTNLRDIELKKLIWALELEKGLGHKIGKSKALLFGSCQISIKQAQLIDWKKRFSSLDDLGLVSFDINKYRPSAKDLANYDNLKAALAIPEL